MAITEEKLQELAKRRETALNAGGKEKIEARHQKGLLSARERLLKFFDEGKFQEFGMHV